MLNKDASPPFGKRGGVLTHITAFGENACDRVKIEERMGRRRPVEDLFSNMTGFNFLGYKEIIIRVLALLRIVWYRDIVF